jgi:hypothetical protein
MGLERPVVTLEGFNASQRLGPVTLDNVIVDNLGPLDVAAEFADVALGPGSVNFWPRGQDVTVTDNRAGANTPRACVFSALPAPEVPAGWLR